MGNASRHILIFKFIIAWERIHSFRIFNIVFQMLSMDQALPKQNRISSIDLLRGIIMVIMALDHTRDFFHKDAMTGDPLNLTTTTPVLFFTRWITHFCAPVFVFLSGLSVYLTGLKRTKTNLGLFLLKRGIWLVVIDVVLMSLILTLNPGYNMIILSVLWAIGMSMLLLALLIRLPYSLLLTIGLVICFGHNLLDTFTNNATGSFKILLGITNGSPALFPVTPSRLVLLSYSVLPWTGIMILGYCFGKLFNPRINALSRVKTLYFSGSVLLLVFIVFRFVNNYGDPVPWSIQKNSLFTFLSFINVSKYPPSLSFASMTLGVALIILALLENAKGKITDFFITYGRVPLFYFILHFFILRFIGVIAFFTGDYPASPIRSIPFYFRPADFGYSLVIVYIIWILVVLFTYPLCNWYGKYKTGHRQWWLSYL